MPLPIAAVLAVVVPTVVEYGPRVIGLAEKGLDMYAEHREQQKDAKAALVTEGIELPVKPKGNKKNNKRQDLKWEEEERDAKKVLVEKGVEVLMGLGKAKNMEHKDSDVEDASGKKKDAKAKLVEKGVDVAAGMAMKGAQSVWKKMNQRKEEKKGREKGEEEEAVMGSEKGRSTESLSLGEEKPVGGHAVFNRKD